MNERKEERKKEKKRLCLDSDVKKERKKETMP